MALYGRLSSVVHEYIFASHQLVKKLHQRGKTAQRMIWTNNNNIFFARSFRVSDFGFYLDTDRTSPSVFSTLVCYPLETTLKYIIVIVFQK